MGRVGAGGTAREAAAGSLLLLLLLLAQPPPAAARNSEESGEPAGLQRHPQRGPGAGGGADCDSRGAPVRSPDAALKRVLILGCAPCGASGPEKPHARFSVPGPPSSLFWSVPDRLSCALEARLWHLRAGRYRNLSPKNS